LLRRTGAAANEPVPMTVGTVRIDPLGRRVWQHDREVAVTTREFDVLEFLIRRAGRVLSKSEILQGVWDDDFDGDPNIVEVYVARLRRKFDDAAPVIATVRGAGYRIGE
jgi:two-component system, OmpR family, response regulator